MFPLLLRGYLRLPPSFFGGEQVQIGQFCQGMADLRDPREQAPGRVRRKGGGRKRAIDKDTSLKTDLESTTLDSVQGSVSFNFYARVVLAARRNILRAERYPLISEV